MNQFNPQGKWPFLYINGEYTQIGAGYSPKLIDDKPFDDLYTALMSGQTTEATTAINAEAAIITRLICSTTGGSARSRVHVTRRAGAGPDRRQRAWAGTLGSDPAGVGDRFLPALRVRAERRGSAGDDRHHLDGRIRQLLPLDGLGL